MNSRKDNIILSQKKTELEEEIRKIGVNLTKITVDGASKYEVASVSSNSCWFCKGKECSKCNPKVDLTRINALLAEIEGIGKIKEEKIYFLQEDCIKILHKNTLKSIKISVNQALQHKYLIWTLKEGSSKIELYDDTMEYLLHTVDLKAPIRQISCSEAIVTAKTSTLVQITLEKHKLKITDTSIETALHTIKDSKILFLNKESTLSLYSEGTVVASTKLPLTEASAVCNTADAFFSCSAEGVLVWDSELNITKIIQLYEIDCVFKVEDYILFRQENRLLNSGRETVLETQGRPDVLVKGEQALLLDTETGVSLLFEQSKTVLNEECKAVF